MPGPPGRGKSRCPRRFGRRSWPFGDGDRRCRTARSLTVALPSPNPEELFGVRREAATGTAPSGGAGDKRPGALFGRRRNERSRPRSEKGRRSGAPRAAPVREAMSSGIRGPGRRDGRTLRRETGPKAKSLSGSELGGARSRRLSGRRFRTMPGRHSVQADTEPAATWFRPGGRGGCGPSPSRAWRFLGTKAPGLQAAAPAMRPSGQGVGRRGGGGSSEPAARRQPYPVHGRQRRAAFRATASFANPGGRLFGAAAAGRRDQAVTTGKTQQADLQLPLGSLTGRLGKPTPHENACRERHQLRGCRGCSSSTAHGPNRHAPRHPFYIAPYSSLFDVRQQGFVPPRRVCPSC